MSFSLSQNCDRIDLNGQWEGICYREGESFSFPGTVPGCAHTDLKGSVLPDDLYHRDNADRCRWIEDCDFRYTRTFSLEQPPEKAVLVFEGLDVYADIYLNDTLIGSTDNMFIPHRFDVTALLRRGENTLSVYFRSPIRAVEGLPECRGAFTTERMHTRRIQCTYGWDWVARFVTCGIWRDVYIDCTTAFAPENVYIYTEAIGRNYAQLVVEAEFQNFEDGGMADLTILDPEDQPVYAHSWFVKERALKAHITLPSPRLWYPAGYGAQPLYTLLLGDKRYPFGIRTVQILELPDHPGDPYYDLCLFLQATPSGQAYDKNDCFSGFQLLVNNKPILCKGANWVPSEPFPSAEDDRKITNLLELGIEAGLNMLRVWGGGIFEREHFYNECDRLGILVTQDFLMACGHYPENTPDFIAQLQKETKAAALQLRNHPCLMWWSGDNENAVLGHDAAETYTGRTAIHQGIRPVLSQYDPHRRFLNSSPFGGNTYASKTCGTTHNTQFLGKSLFPYILNSRMVDYKEHFKEYLARFIAEEPSMGAACLPSLRLFMTEEDIYGDLAMWEYHTKSNPALKTSLFEYLLQFTEKVLGSFADGADRYFKLKYIQYEWLRVSMETVRRNQGFCNGVIYWMWNDCWPAAAGWSIVDYYGLPKAAFYSFKRCAKELMLSIDVADGRYCIYVSNTAAVSRTVELTFYTLRDGVVRQLSRYTAIANGESAKQVFSIGIERFTPDTVLICDMTCGEQRDRTFYRNGTLPLKPAGAVRTVHRGDDSITVTAESYVHAVELEGQYIFSDNFFSLLPGETRTVSFRKAAINESDEIRVSGYTL